MCSAELLLSWDLWDNWQCPSLSLRKDQRAGFLADVDSIRTPGLGAKSLNSFEPLDHGKGSAAE
jgi:hypothetical protein